MQPAPRAMKKGPAFVTHLDQGISHWMPDPAEGFTSVIVAPINSEVTAFSFGVQRLEPGEVLPEHFHRNHEELFYVYRGRGTVTLDGEVCAIGPGSTVFSGRNTAHTFTNTGEEPLEFCWFFTPAGLEHVLDNVGAPRTPGSPRPAAVPPPSQLGALARHITSRGRPER